ncbi:MAG: type II toxin-antitoxin system VapC family toxin [Caulobacterales bacterium]
MSALVLDASAAIGLLAPSQSSPALAQLAADLADCELIAPAVFAVELRHALLKLERRRLVGPSALDQDLPNLERLITRAPPLSRREEAAALELARVEHLGFYDAIYLDLAARISASLATRDDPLIAAALRRGVAVTDLR